LTPHFLRGLFLGGGDSPQPCPRPTDGGAVRVLHLDPVPRWPGPVGCGQPAIEYDSTDRYPAIAAVAAKLRAKSFTLDGEAAVSGADGIAVFEALYRRRAAPDAILHAFDLLELNGKDLRPLPLGEHKAKLARQSFRAHLGARDLVRGVWFILPW
jgi:hypothetical protein